MPSKRYFYDTEFLDNGHTIDLISIGIVAEDGRGYYAVNTEANIDAAKTNPWIVANVLPHLPMNNRGCLDRVAADGRHPTLIELEQVDLDRTRAETKTKDRIAAEVREFLTADLPDDGDTWCELWADYGAYDHVALAQLWGPMIALPPGIPMFTHDIQQYAAHLGIHHNNLPDNTGNNEHNALADADNTRARWQYLHVVEHAQRAKLAAYPAGLTAVARAADALIEAVDSGELKGDLTESHQWEELNGALEYLAGHRQETTTDEHNAA